MGVLVLITIICLELCNKFSAIPYKELQKRGQLYSDQRWSDVLLQFGFMINVEAFNLSDSGFFKLLSRAIFSLFCVYMCKCTRERAGTYVCMHICRALSETLFMHPCLFCR